MSQGRRSVWIALLCFQALGCGATQTAALPRQSLADDLACNITATEDAPRLARSQRPDAPAPVTLPALGAPAPTASGTRQTNLVVPRGNRINVRAWVNGKPIFDEEVMQNISPVVFKKLASLSEAQRSEVIADIFNQTLDQIIEQEVVYQEAIRKLEKLNPRTLDKLRTMAEQDFDKQVQKIQREGKASEAELKEFQRQ